MPDSRRHRGQNPEDPKLFSAKNIPSLKEAVVDLSFLLTKGYNITSAAKLVGDRYMLNERQRIAISRNSCSDQALKERALREVTGSFIEGKKLFIDGYNILITIESALSHGLVFIGRDGGYRDISGIHGSYKKVEETLPAIELIGKHIQALKPQSVTWYLDSPVSNSGRLKVLLYEIATKFNWNWSVELVFNPDNELKLAGGIVATSDAIILNEVKSWINLTKVIINEDIKDCNLIDLRQTSPSLLP